MGEKKVVIFGIERIYKLLYFKLFWTVSVLNLYWAWHKGGKPEFQ